VSLREERDGTVAILTLDRPDVLNAFDDALTDSLQAHIGELGIDDDSVRAIVITGAGRAFSAGQDLRDRKMSFDRGDPLDLGDELRLRYHPIISVIRKAQKPVIAAVNGVVAGAGLGIALSCDIRVATASATFRAAWTRVGLVPDAGSAYLLPRVVGLGRAMDMVLTGDPVDATEALRIGLVTRVWSDSTFESAWRAFAQQLAAGATSALALTKQGLQHAADQEFELFLSSEAMLQDRAGKSADYVEGVRAFLDKRPPRFTGS
jgi:2-(1,2-epoxy-1,2-dihydrophenyl)acetyl-CoA isomerase